MRFINNCQKIKKKGPLAASEIQCQEKCYIKHEKKYNTVRNLKKVENS